MNPSFKFALSKLSVKWSSRSTVQIANSQSIKSYLISNEEPPGYTLFTFTSLSY
jgi:hypothetical protein